MEEKKEIKEKTKSGSNVVDKFTGYIAAFLLGAGVAGGICWYIMGYSQRRINAVGKEFVAVEECRDILKKNAGIADGKPVKSAIAAYVDSIAVDKFTYYYEDDETASAIGYVNDSGTAKLSGFKINAAEDGNILLAEVTEGMPAYMQGLRAGDEISAIDGNSVIEAGFNNIANKMLGKDGTKVTFTVLRNGEPFDVIFTRSSEMISGVKFEKMGDVAYIRITEFGQLTQGQLQEALVNSKGMKKLVFDLRNNLGGETDAGVYMAALVCGHSKCIQTGFDGSVNVIEKNFEHDDLKREIVILINEETASSSEIFVASVKSSTNATLVGTNTYGKGVYQREKILSNGGHLHYTAGTYIVEGWDNWHDKGIAPDVEVPMDKEYIGTENDVQLKKALALLD